MKAFSRSKSGHCGMAWRGVALAAACWGAATVAVAAGQAPAVLLEGDGVQITSADVIADAQRLPPVMRDSFLGVPNNVKSIARNLYIRRVMAERAKTATPNDPVVAAAARIAVDKALSDMYLQVFNEQHQPAAEALDAQVRATYQAQKESFKLPAQVHVAHILVAQDAPDAEAHAQKLLEELRGGADFAELAQKESADPGSGSKGGDLGWVGKGKMVPPFEEAAFALKNPGELSGVVKSAFGYHIIKLLESRPERLQTLDEVRPQIEKQITDKMLDTARSAEVERVTQDLKMNDAAINAFSGPYEAKAAPKK